MIKNKFYEAPETELILVGFEGNFCTSPTYTQGGGGQYGDDDTNDNDEY